MQPSTDSAPPKLEIVRVSSACALGHFGDVLVVSWRQAIVLEDIRALIVLRNQLMRRGLAGAVQMAEPGLSLPDEECRKAAREGMLARAGSEAPVALTIFGSGFGASAIRSVGTAIFALRSGPPTRIFSTLSEATSWLAGHSAAVIDAFALTQACDAMRTTQGRS